MRVVSTSEIYILKTFTFIRFNRVPEISNSSVYKRRVSVNLHIISQSKIR